MEYLRIFSGREPSIPLQSARPGAHFPVYDRPDIRHKQLRRYTRREILLDDLLSESSDTRKVPPEERLRARRSGTPTCNCSSWYRGHPLLPAPVFRPRAGHGSCRVLYASGRKEGKGIFRLSGSPNLPLPVWQDLLHFV